MKYNRRLERWELKLGYGMIIKMNKPKNKNELWTYLIIDENYNHFCLFYNTLPKHTLTQW